MVIEIEIVGRFEVDWFLLYFNILNEFVVFLMLVLFLDSIVVEFSFFYCIRNCCKVLI